MFVFVLTGLKHKANKEKENNGFRTSDKNDVTRFGTNK